VSSPRVTIISTGVANTASVAAAFRRLGADVELVDDPARVREASRVVLPGVGSFGTGMERLRSRGLADAVTDRVRDGRSLLAVCLGLQLLCESSDESPGVQGLGIVPARVERFPEGVPAPQFGWNRVESDPSCGIVRTGSAYFANSYRVIDPPPGWAVSVADHGGRFVASMERGSVCACQFHPELSGTWGAEVLRRWLVREEVGAPC